MNDLDVRKILLALKGRLPKPESGYVLDSDICAAAASLIDELTNACDVCVYNPKCDFECGDCTANGVCRCSTCTNLKWFG